MVFASSFPIQLFASAFVGGKHYPMGSRNIPTSEKLKIICDFVIPKEEQISLERIEVFVDGKVKAIKKIRKDNSNNNFKDLQSSSKNEARTSSGRVEIDLKSHKVYGNGRYIYLRIFGYRGKKLIPSPIYVAPFYLE